MHRTESNEETKQMQTLGLHACESKWRQHLVPGNEYHCLSALTLHKAVVVMIRMQTCNRRHIQYGAVEITAQLRVWDHKTRAKHNSLQGGRREEHSAKMRNHLEVCMSSQANLCPFCPRFNQCWIAQQTPTIPPKGPLKKPSKTSRTGMEEAPLPPG